MVNDWGIFEECYNDVSGRKRRVRPGNAFRLYVVPGETTSRKRWGNVGEVCILAKPTYIINSYW